MKTKTAAIHADDLDNTTLNQLSATQFVEALHTRKAFEVMHFWPEKKKYELEINPSFGDLRFGDFVNVHDNIKGEKKKVEYEIQGILDGRPQPHPVFAPEITQVMTQLDQLAAQVQNLSNKINDR